MGQTSSRGIDGNVNQANNSKENELSEKEKELKRINELMNKKSLEFNNLLELFNFYINVRILDKSFALKNNIIIKEIDSENENLETNIKNNDNLYLNEMRNLKHDMKVLYSKKFYYNLFYGLNVFLVITLIALTILSIITYRRQA